MNYFVSSHKGGSKTRPQPTEVARISRREKKFARKLGGNIGPVALVLASLVWAEPRAREGGVGEGFGRLIPVVRFPHVWTDAGERGACSRRMVEGRVKWLFIPQGYLRCRKYGYRQLKLRDGPGGAPSSLLQKPLDVFLHLVPVNFPSLPKQGREGASLRNLSFESEQGQIFAVASKRENCLGKKSVSGVSLDRNVKNSDITIFKNRGILTVKRG